MTRGSESFTRMVLQSIPPPAWLVDPAPDADVVLSTRLRVMRNLSGRRFPHRADSAELDAVMRDCLGAARGGDLEAHHGLTNAERDYLVGARLVSPEFEWTLPGRVLLLDRRRQLSLMVNEEDHLRLQAIVGGWDIRHSEQIALSSLDRLGRTLSFAHAPGHGYLAASPENAGLGLRHSAMFHLIGLAHSRRLPGVIRALATLGIVVRGLFGESSRAIGAFLQVSVLRQATTDFTAACDYLVAQERAAREEMPLALMNEQVARARSVVETSRSLGLADAVRALAWMRWAALAGLPGYPTDPRAVDRALTSLEMRPTPGDETSAARADLMRRALSL